mmetsp:Transcript_33515/g.34013  ORF Transcript_33515/g.34013 Transcript_33515/m.34013 type:complete len:88 (+) Transcript_33515:1380-1643(+)
MRLEMVHEENLFQITQFRSSPDLLATNSTQGSVSRVDTSRKSGSVQQRISYEKNRSDIFLLLVALQWSEWMFQENAVHDQWRLLQMV